MKAPLLHISIAVSAFALALLAYGVLYGVISAKSATVASLQNTIDTKAEAASRAAAARSALAKTSADEDLVQAYFVSETGVVAFIDDLQRRGDSLGSVVSVSSVQPSGTAAATAFILALSIKGSFDAVMRTFGSIEYAPYNLSVLEFSLIQEEGAGWRADFTLRAGSVPTPPTNNVIAVSYEHP